jgi:3-hydroxyacyl-[acyl-carrier-protein] dehydratase|tara:strand:+ start:332 stop:796 length:465 start_codon:yes stop_codon:yes gene_type:complete
MKFLTLDKEKILEFQNNRSPYLFIDYATKVIPGQSAEGYKNLPEDEWFFKVHWPGDPNMPGFLQMEALTQMCSLSILTLPGNKGELMYLTSANDIQLKKKVIPNSKLYIFTKVIKYTRGFGLFEAKGFVDEELACSAKINLVLPKEIKKYKIKK